MFKEFYSEFDRVKVPKIVVDKVINKALSLDDQTDTAKVHLRNRTLSAGIMAACFLLVFVCTFMFCVNNNAHTRIESRGDYGFVINANAKNNGNIPIASEKTLIGAYSGSLTGGWAMYENFEKYEDSAPNYFQSYTIGKLLIEGEGIESVKIKANKNGTYFALSPAGYFGNNESVTQDALKDYSDLSLANSQYTAEELRMNSDGLSYGNVYCDTFSYNNISESNEINLGCKIEFIIESNKKDSSQAQLLNNIWLYEEDIIVEKESGKPSTQKLNKLYIELQDASIELQELVLKDATIDVIVCFENGTEQIKTLNMELVATESDKWLVISE